MQKISSLSSWYERIHLHLHSIGLISLPITELFWSFQIPQRESFQIPQRESLRELKRELKRSMKQPSKLLFIKWGFDVFFHIDINYTTREIDWIGAFKLRTSNTKRSHFDSFFTLIDTSEDDIFYSKWTFWFFKELLFFKQCSVHFP